MSLIICSHFLCPSLSLYKTWPHLRPGFILYHFLQRPSLPCIWIKSFVLVSLGETLCGQPSLSSWGPCSSLQPLSAAWRLLYNSVQANQWGPITKSWELASVAALFSSHCTMSREPQPSRVSQKCDFFFKKCDFWWLHNSSFIFLWHHKLSQSHSIDVSLSNSSLMVMMTFAIQSINTCS